MSLRLSAPDAKSAFSKNLSRLSRFVGFIEASRSESNLGIRISLYMTCLEILFTTDASELTQKLSQRVACFLSDSKAERISTFRTIKRAYLIRSTVVHGDCLKPRLEAELSNICVEIDDILRRLFNLIMSDPQHKAIFGKNDQDLEDYFLNLTFDSKDMS